LTRAHCEVLVTKLEDKFALHDIEGLIEVVGVQRWAVAGDGAVSITERW
jgi:hypothetical protein